MVEDPAVVRRAHALLETVPVRQVHLYGDGTLFVVAQRGDDDVDRLLSLVERVLELAEAMDDVGRRANPLLPGRQKTNAEGQGGGSVAVPARL